MARPRLTIDDARTMDLMDLAEAGHAILREYEAPEVETRAQLEARISKTLDQLPDVYAWFKQLHAFFDHWTDFYASQHGVGAKSIEYKAMRQKRDAIENLAHSAKLRYEGTSRRLTQLMGADEEVRMPRGR